MKILVVEQESHRVKDLQKIFAHLDENIRVKIITPGLQESSAWLYDRFFQPDLVLVSPESIEKGLSPLPANEKLMATVTFTSPSAAYSFRAYRLGKINEQALTNVNAIGTALFPQATTKAIPLRQRFLVKQGQKYFPVDITEIAYFFSDKRFIFFKTFADQKFLVEYRMDELEQMLDEKLFFRINRAFILSVQAIEHVQPYPRHRLKIFVKPFFEQELIVSRERTLSFKSWLGE